MHLTKLPQQAARQTNSIPNRSIDNIPMNFEKYLIYELGTCKAIPPKNEADRLPDIKYCKDWSDLEGRGLACISWATIDPETMQLERTFSSLWDGYSYRQLFELKDSKRYFIGGFNSWAFDDPLLRASNFQHRSDFDIQDLILEAAGVKGLDHWKKGYRYNLTSIAAANGMAKTGHGENAPILYQKGMFTKLLSSCLNDSIVSAEILVKLLKGELIDPNTQQLLKIDPAYLIEHI